MYNDRHSTVREAIRPARLVARILSITAMTLLLGGLARPAHAQQPWSAVPGGCASTDNNFAFGTTNVDFPVARYRTPGGAVAFNGFHDGVIAFICNVDNPRDTSNTPRWNELQVTYRDPDGLGQPDGRGTEYTAIVELFRVSKKTGGWALISSFNSDAQCAPSPACIADNTVRTISVPFTHGFDFANFAYGVSVKLHRALATFSLSPAVYQIRLQPAPPVLGQSNLEFEAEAR